MSQLNLLHGTDNEKVESRKTKKAKKTDILRSISKQYGEPVESVRKKKRKATVGSICRKGRSQAWKESVSEGWKTQHSVATCHCSSFHRIRGTGFSFANELIKQKVH